MMGFLNAGTRFPFFLSVSSSGDKLANCSRAIWKTVSLPILQTMSSMVVNW